MSLPAATLYKEYLASAKEAAEKRLALLREENLVYNQIIPTVDASQPTGAWSDDDYASRGPTQSKYLSPDYPLTVDTYSEAMIYNFPTFDFEGNGKEYSKEDVDQLNGIFKKVAFANNLPYKMMNVIRTGVRKASCACELVPVTVNVDREYKVNGVWIRDTATTYTGVLDLIRYLPSQTFIDPNADPDDVRNTAEYCIAYLGFYSKSVYDAMAKRNGWKTGRDIQEISATTFTDEGGEEQEKNIEGITRGTGVKVSKLFLRDGTVQVVVNDDFIVWEGINAKRIHRMPLIFYKSLPGGSTPYGRLLWLTMRPSVMAYSVATNLILDNIGKNLCGPTFTSIKELADENMNEFENGEIRYLRTADQTKKMDDQVLHIEFPDMTQGAQYALGKFATDIARVTRLDSLSQGTQGEQQVRTNYIAQQLSQPSLTQKSAFVKQAEFSFFQEFGRDMVAILYANYEDFSGMINIDRQKLADIRNIRVRQGSTLEEDRMSQVQKMGEMVKILLSTQEDGYSVDKALEGYFTAIGINDPEWYKLPLDQLLMKAFMKAGADPALAQAMTMDSISKMKLKQGAAGGAPAK